MRLIDADVLIEDIERSTFSRTIKEFFEDFVEDAPTVEAKPVVYGEWKYDWLGEYICSNCYERVTVKEVMGEPAWDWCPACGARMVKDNE